LKSGTTELGTTLTHTLSSDDYINDGDCPTCGKYKERIDRGKMKPCFMWERIKEEEEEDAY